MAILAIFKKGSGSLKKSLFEAGWNSEYFVSVKFTDSLFALNETDILLKVH